MLENSEQQLCEEIPLLSLALWTMNQYNNTLHLLFQFSDNVLPSAATVAIRHEGRCKTFDLGFLGKMNVGLAELQYVFF